MLNLIYNNFNSNFSVLKNTVKDKIGLFNSKKVVILTGLCISVSLLAFTIIKKFTKNPTPSQQTKQPISNSDKQNGWPNVYSKAKHINIPSNFNQTSIVNKQNS